MQVAQRAWSRHAQNVAARASPAAPETQPGVSPAPPGLTAPRPPQDQQAAGQAQHAPTRCGPATLPNAHSPRSGSKLACSRHWQVPCRAPGPSPDAPLQRPRHHLCGRARSHSAAACMLVAARYLHACRAGLVQKRARHAGCAPHHMHCSAPHAPGVGKHLRRDASYSLMHAAGIAASLHLHRRIS